MRRITHFFTNLVFECLYSVWAIDLTILMVQDWTDSLAVGSISNWRLLQSWIVLPHLHLNLAIEGPVSSPTANLVECQRSDEVVDFSQNSFLGWLVGYRLLQQLTLQQLSLSLPEPSLWIIGELASIHFCELLEADGINFLENWQCVKELFGNQVMVAFSWLDSALFECFIVSPLSIY